MEIRGAREHNLKNVNLDIPRGKIVAFTGRSGSGKSSLAFDTIYAEGYRKYMESLSADARRLLSQIDKPAVESIRGLSPVIAIEQVKSLGLESAQHARNAHRNSRLRKGALEPCWRAALPQRRRKNLAPKRGRMRRRGARASARLARLHSRAARLVQARRSEGGNQKPAPAGVAEGASQRRNLRA